jgi:two-component system, NarL family, invasion response regulator UvrY
MKRFLLADDHHIVRTGLALLLKDEFLNPEIDECRNGDCVMKKVRNTGYDLVILDIMMPGTDSLHLLNHIFIHQPAQKVMIFTMCSAGIYAKKYLQLGVRGFVNKEAEPSEVRKTIAAILNNRQYPSTQYILTHNDPDNQSSTPFDKLSVRELEIMNHLVGGKNVSDIANILSVHISTVSTHKANIMQKLGVSNVVELTRLVQLF